ncbi:hypothetical protein [Paracerasibacillus soli]|uniref:Uncharacterized protein n=1 Tax=Paracerasibacillus soli TaxID=480284 RepID=A0ABU5CS13_9BACI|nr:hypothetical protein [Virgibacillus soli]MDY0409025.1 hypothetical protein [Virgibacillus soli]
MELINELIENEYYESLLVAGTEIIETNLKVLEEKSQKSMHSLANLALHKLNLVTILY